jgi:hypothetical protein
MGPKRKKCPECNWVGGDHANNCLLGAEAEFEDYGLEADESDDELEFDEEPEFGDEREFDED